MGKVQLRQAVAGDAAAIAFSDGRDNEEREPDGLYEWIGP